jgi:hypothetical protein
MAEEFGTAFSGTGPLGFISQRNKIKMVSKRKGTAMNMPKVKKCDVKQCCYNSNNICHALAINVGGSATPRCDTYTTTCKSKAGDSGATATVGACKVSGCRYNMNLECQASEISVSKGKDPADCITFEPI